MMVGDVMLMGSDAPPDRYHRPQGITVAIGIADPNEAERLFAALAAGAPMQRDSPVPLVPWPDADAPIFAGGGTGLVSTVDDYHAFARMLFAGGGSILTPASVEMMTTDQLTSP